MKDFCECDGNNKGELILAAIVAFIELGIFWFTQKAAASKSEMNDELAHFKDESRYLRGELERERDKISAIERELHELGMAINYADSEEVEAE